MKEKIKGLPTAMGKNRLSAEDLLVISGGTDPDIKVTIKTLPGENEDYKVPLADSKFRRFSDK